TLEGAVGKVARDYTRDARSHTHTPPETATADIEHRFQRVESQGAKLDQLVASLGEEEPGRSLVFVRTKRGADRLVKRLRTENVEAVAMHGDKSQRQREAALARYERGEVWTLVATDVAARGIDVPDVVRVINYDEPEDRAAYVHRIGRTGRAGRTGTGISFVLADEVKEMRSIARQLGIDFGEGHTEGGAPAPSGESRPPAEKHRGESGKPSHGGAKRSHGGSGKGGNRSSRGGSNKSSQSGDKREQSDGPRRKRRRRRNRKGSTVTAANSGSRD
ncbi:MAG TPA: helicase-related protein, partial [Solirubrobacterales bacterium]